MFSLILLIAIGVVGVESYRLWTGGPWDLPNQGKGTSIYAVEPPKDEADRPSLVSTETIVSRNIFDPERGEGRSRQAEESSQAVQRVRNMILLGTAILGNNRVAILQDSPAMRAGAGRPGQTSEPMRVKLGDTVEGFRLSEIADKRVVFTRGASRVEVMLDFFRKAESIEPTPAPPAPGTKAAPGQVVAPRPGVPRVVPNLPRRDRLPTPPNPGPEP